MITKQNKKKKTIQTSKQTNKQQKNDKKPKNEIIS